MDNYVPTGEPAQVHVLSEPQPKTLPHHHFIRFSKNIWPYEKKGLAVMAALLILITTSGLAILGTTVFGQFYFNNQEKTVTNHSTLDTNTLQNYLNQGGSSQNGETGLGVITPTPTPKPGASPTPTAAAKNVATKTPTPTPTVKKTTSSSPTSTPTPVKTPTPTPTSVPTPTPTPANSGPPQMTISYPSNGQSITMDSSQTFCIVDVPGSNTNGVQRRYHASDAGWSNYEGVSSPLCYSPAEGSNTMYLQYKNSNDYESQVYSVTFTFHRT